MKGSAWRRPAVAAVIVAILLGVVALASGRRSWSGHSSSSNHLPDQFWDVVLTVGIILWLAFAAWALWNTFTNRAGGGRKVARDPKKVILAILITMSVFAAVAAWRAQHPSSHRHGTTVKIPQNPTGTLPQRGVGGGRGLQPQFNLPAAIATVTFLFMAAVIGVIVKQRMAPTIPERRRAAAAALAEVLDETLDDLRNEPDPRRAVIAAYARMERTLALFGLVRHRSEAPAEYLTRVLPELDASGTSVMRLTKLFEWAKFSTHDVNGQMKTEAIDALVALREELVRE